MKFVKSLIAVAALSTVAMSASAAVNYQGAGQPYIGAKVGQFQIDGADKNPTAYGVYGGYNFGNGFGVEAEFLGSDEVKTTVGAATVDYKVKNYGIYGTYNYNFANSPLYLKAKLGGAKSEMESTANVTVGSTSISRSGSSDTSGLAYGVGLGYSPSKNFGVEAEYTRITQDDGLITLGANLKF